MSATGIDEAKLEAFMGKAVGDMGAIISAPLFVIGEKLGLYKAMAGAGPLSSDEVAERSGAAERYVREWLRNQAAGGYVESDAPVKLGGRAFDTLLVLVQERQRALPKGELMERVWPGLIVEENNLQVQIAALRKILGQDVIATIPGRGYQLIRALDHPAAPAAATPEFKHNLPRLLTSFVGREDDLEEYAQLLGQTRLLTLTGIGGCGKTRLAIELAERALSSFPDGVCYVDLARSDRRAGARGALRRLLGIRDENDRPIVDTLCDQALLSGTCCWSSTTASIWWRRAPRSGTAGDWRRPRRARCWRPAAKG